MTVFAYVQHSTIDYYAAVAVRVHLNMNVRIFNIDLDSSPS